MNNCYDKDGLNDAARKVIEKWGTIDDYIDGIITKYGLKSGECWSDRRIQFEDVILPTWVTFPGYEPGCIGWRMGDGEDYISIFYNYIELLTKEEYLQYREAYPIPLNVYGDILDHLPEEFLTPEDIDYQRRYDQLDLLYWHSYRDMVLEFHKETNQKYLQRSNVSPELIRRISEMLDSLEEPPFIDIKDDGTVEFVFVNPETWIKMEMTIPDDKQVHICYINEYRVLQSEEDIPFDSIGNKLHEFLEEI